MTIVCKSCDKESKYKYESERIQKTGSCGNFTCSITVLHLYEIKNQYKVFKSLNKFFNSYFIRILPKPFLQIKSNGTALRCALDEHLEDLMNFILIISHK